MNISYSKCNQQKGQSSKKLVMWLTTLYTWQWCRETV